ncbi:chorismate mutase [Herbidospora sp. NEAU-GS84]|uniref:chorismate mutase n=1 Tax=Herbidospora solisilvae TaxID=2696284 RepID=A0A7C9N423_9ACTN|nr:chorismate mutase [Herbidospora solisilvae]NAS25950.1 chorismate mutase [Herbidospora solisilvae]
MISAIAGGIRIDSDDVESIAEGVRELVLEVLARNGLSPADLIDVIFTSNLRSSFPAFHARRLGLHDVPLMCATELTEAGTPGVVRLLAHVSAERGSMRATNVYLRGAAPYCAGTER